MLFVSYGCLKLGSSHLDLSAQLLHFYYTSCNQVAAFTTLNLVLTLEVTFDAK